jgi:multidrug efflux pump subunit AcrA (membrane-fusion protein)
MLTRSLIAKCGAATGFFPAILFFYAASQSLAADSPKPTPLSPAVTVIKAKKICFDNTIEVTGVLVPKTEVLVRPDREGLQISKVLVEAGTKVSAGQSLAQLVQPDAPTGSGDFVSVQAPVAGIVVRSAAIVGSMASARAEPLFQIIAGGDLELSAQITTRNLPDLVSGLPAKIRVVGVGELPGRVRFVSKMVDSTTQLGEVSITINPEERLKIGTFGRAIINAGQRCDKPGVPLSALLYGIEGTVAQVVRDERIETRLVAAGLQANGNVEILQGIAEGDMVVARSGAFLRDGDRVRSFVVGEPAARK